MLKLGYMEQKDFAKKVTSNTVYQLAGKAVSTVLGLIAVAIMTRYLGREGFGGYATIIAFLQFFGIIVDFGLTIITVQMISEPGADEKKIASNIFTLRFFSAIIFLGLAPLVVLFFPYSPLIKIGVLVTTLSFLFIALHQVLVGIFQKHLQMGKVALAEIIGRVALVLGIVLAVFLDSGLLGVMAAVVAGSFFNWLMTFIFSRKLIKISWAFDFSLWKEIIRRSWPIGISIMFNLIYLKADTLILSLVRTQEEVGLYGASYRVVDVFTMIPIMIVGVVLPSLTYYWAERNREKFREVMQLAFNGLSILAMPVLVGTLFLATPVMVFIAGEDFAPSGAILKILIFGVTAIFFGQFFGHLVVALHKQKQMVWGYIITAILTLIGYLIFIPRYSYYGAAAMTVFSEVLICLLTFLMVYSTSRVLPSLKILFKALAASLVMGASIYVLRELHILILIAMAVFIYFVVLYLMKGFSKEFLRELVRVKKTAE